jgi:uncharacterized protein YgiM (DUF1202 family)
MSKTQAIPLMIIILTLASLACLETTIPTPAASRPTPTQTARPTPDEDPAGAVFDTNIWLTPRAELCAEVTASQALHMRDEAGETGLVIGYLYSGEQVKVLELGDWWKIEAHGMTGYANAKYLQEEECQ